MNVQPAQADVQSTQRRVDHLCETFIHSEVDLSRGDFRFARKLINQAVQWSFASGSSVPVILLDIDDTIGKNAKNPNRPDEYEFRIRPVMRPLIEFLRGNLVNTPKFGLLSLWQRDSIQQALNPGGRLGALSHCLDECFVYSALDLPNGRTLIPQTEILRAGSWASAGLLSKLEYLLDLQKGADQQKFHLVDDLMSPSSELLEALKQYYLGLFERILVVSKDMQPEFRG